MIINDGSGKYTSITPHTTPFPDTRATTRTPKGGAKTPTPTPKPGAPAKPPPHDLGMTPTEKNASTRAKNEAAADPSMHGTDGPGTAGGNAARRAASAGNAASAKIVTGARRYNAPLHPHSRPVLTGAGSHGAGPRPYYTGEIIALYEQQGGMGEDASTNSDWYSRKEANWAFRFLYNPASFVVSTQIDASATPTLLDPGLFFGQQQAIGFDLYLNRMAELNSGLSPGRGSRDEAAILKQGTQYDVNHLYKVVNGDRGDVGFLVNTLVRVVFGPSIFYEGFITNIDVQHTQFNAQMLPMASKVTLNLTRVSNIQSPANATTT